MRGLLAFWLFLPMVSLAQVAAPVAARHPVIDTYGGGLTITDNYRWLEDGTSPETKQWVAGENAHSTALLNAIPQRDKVLAYVKQLTATMSPSYYSFQVRDGRAFALRSDPAESSDKLVTFSSLEDKASERRILDFGNLDSTKTRYQADWYRVSPDGKTVAISLSTGGSEDGALHLFSTTTGQPLDVVIPHVQFATAGGSLAWNADSKGFLYTRYPREGERPAEDAHFFLQVFEHRLGTPVSADTQVLGPQLPRIAEIALNPSADNTHTLAQIKNGDGSEFEIFSIGPDRAVQQVTHFADKIVSASYGADYSLWLLSHATSARGTMLHLTSASTPLADAKLVVPASEAAIETSEKSDYRQLVIADRLYLCVINGGPEQLRVYTLDGKRLPDVSLPPVSSVSGMVPAGDSSFVVVASTYTQPPQRYRVAAAEGIPHLLPFTMASPVSLADVEVERLFATSKDGTRVPLTVLHRKGLTRDGNNPTLLYGYGGYGISMTPFFNPAMRPFFDAGGIYAVANLRGGGEYGEDWHTGGNLLHKQNVFDDFAASAQLLLDQHYTNSTRLAAQGGSNGGLLMGAMITQHPAMFKAILSEVGIYDMLRVELDPNGTFNTTEFGSVKDPAQRKALYSYSPYHHVKAGVAYPAILFVTGDNDHRVNPANSRKMIALLQADTAGKAPILLLTNANAGHGLYVNVDEADLEYADQLAFIYNAIGISLP